MKKVLSIFIVLLSTYYIPTSNNYMEEASPIREEDKMVGMNYTITLDKYIKKNNLSIDTSIISSINHYKDINTIDNFYVDLKIDNKSKYDYVLKSIIIINKNKTSKKIKYKRNKRKNIYFIKLKKEYLDNNSYIKLELEK